MSALLPELVRVSASDAPVRAPGTRARSGNAMHRTRTALLEATGDCLARYGVRKTTMVDVAARSRVAKATLYNHFRTKDDLLAAYVEERVTALVVAASAVAGSAGLASALDAVAEVLAQDPALRRAAAEEPALLTALCLPSKARGWEQARDGVRTVLAAARVEPTEEDVELVLRWATSQVLWPVVGAGGIPTLVGGLSGARSGSVADAPVATGRASAPEQPGPALGWPR